MDTSMKYRQIAIAIVLCMIATMAGFIIQSPTATAAEPEPTVAAKSKRVTDLGPIYHGGYYDKRLLGKKVAKVKNPGFRIGEDGVKKKFGQIRWLKSNRKRGGNFVLSVDTATAHAAARGKEFTYQARYKTKKKGKWKFLQFTVKPYVDYTPTWTDKSETNVVFTNDNVEDTVQMRVWPQNEVGKKSSLASGDAEPSETITIKPSKKGDQEWVAYVWTKGYWHAQQWGGVY